MVTASYLDRGTASRSSVYCMKRLQRDTRGPGEDQQTFKQHPGTNTYGQKFGLARHHDASASSECVIGSMRAVCKPVP